MELVIIKELWKAAIFSVFVFAWIIPIDVMCQDDWILILPSPGLEFMSTKIYLKSSIPLPGITGVICYARPQSDRKYWFQDQIDRVIPNFWIAKKGTFSLQVEQ